MEERRENEEITTEPGGALDLTVGFERMMEITEFDFQTTALADFSAAIDFRRYRRRRF